MFRALVFLSLLLFAFIINHTPIQTKLVYDLEEQLQSYHDEIGFRGYLNPNNTDYWSYWADDAGKILTAAAILHNYTIAQEAFDFIYKIKAYGYEMPARIVQFHLHYIGGGLFGNELLGIGGKPLKLGIDLHGFNCVTQIISVNGVKNYVNKTPTEYTYNGTIIKMINNHYIINGKANITFNITHIGEITIKAYYQNLTCFIINKTWQGKINALLIINPIEGVINDKGGFIVIGNITQVKYENNTLQVSGENLKIYIFDITFDPVEANYVVYGLLKGLYPNNADISTPVSFGFIMLGLTLYYKETHNKTILNFARGFLNFWLPIVEKEIKDNNYYDRSLSTFFIGVILLEPKNQTILNLAKEYLPEKPHVFAPECIGLNAAFIKTLCPKSQLIQQYAYYEKETSLSKYHSAFHFGEDLLGWLIAGYPYNSTIVLTLVNTIFNEIIPFQYTQSYVFINSANTEGIPAVMESIGLWQETLENKTGILINRWNNINVEKMYYENNSLHIIGKPLGDIILFEYYGNYTINIKNASILVITHEGDMTKLILTTNSTSVEITISKGIVRNSQNLIVLLVILIVITILILVIIGYYRRNNL
ncbi:hypothetical protein [Saccharolobus caldissimus]|uniref:Uncharacterized protein n=1 Tax=Saccharolobus caldissimus TaxID=1702097 RepID=A0AAQ4CPZ7_9CREN|nr:hypothetical protein [Saccharolobus caldissimus]BDB97878.1 hypothetical protein SACC_08950 [Saccharolobus caldissimus]